MFVLGSDGQDYYELGTNLLFGDGFGRVQNGTFMFADDRTPLYSLFVAISVLLGGGSSTIVLALFQAVIAALTGVVAYGLARRILPELWSAAVVIPFAFEPVAASLHLLSYAETLLTFFVLLSIEYLLRAIEKGKVSYAALSAGAVACASYTKPVAAYFAAGMIVVVIACGGRQRIKIAWVFITIVLLLLLPWVARNAVRTGNSTFTTFGERVFCGYQLSAFYAAKDRFPDATPEYAIGKVIHDEQYREVYERCVYGGSVLGQTIFLIQESPRAFIKANSIVLFAYLTNDGVGQIFSGPSRTGQNHHAHLSGIVLLGTEWKAHVRDAYGMLETWQQVVLVIARLLWVSISLMAILGWSMLMWNSAHRPLAVVLGISIFYFAGVTVLAGGLGAGARFRYIINYQLLILSGAFLYVFAQHALRTYKKSRATDSIGDHVNI